MTRGIFILTVVVLSAASAAGSDAGRFFETKIRPVLSEKCFECHSATAEKLKAGLRVDHRELLLGGGDTGPAIEPGHAGRSLLVEAIGYGNEDLQMPPKEKLGDAVRKDFEKWIADGAYWPDEPVPERGGGRAEDAFELEKRRQEHWSWRPVKRPEPPETGHRDWPRAPLDRFVLARMEAEGLRPAEDAARQTWLRRVSFGLTGLPPTPEEIEVFLADDSPDAFEKVVEERLGSPHFGETWARHWMDLVRYADTYGHEFDYPIRHAHEYRDYLVRAFNEDVPYDLFVKEHIAGDLLREPRRHPEEGYNESVIGTGFWYLHEATHAPTDVLANEADIMDNQIDVFGKSFLGLTVSCARCHDHKFDAVSTEDYYAMTAYLHGSARQERPIDEGRIRERSRSRQEEIKAKADALLSRDALETPRPGSGGTVYEDFGEGIIPAGWSTTGFAFAGAGDRVGIRFDGSDPLTVPGTVDSGIYGKERVGALRSPAFTIEGDRIHILMKANDAAVKLVVDNYQMAAFQPLLFKGTLAKEIDTEGEFQWITLDRDLGKYVGHKAYLDFTDQSSGSMVIDEIRFADGGSAPDFAESGAAGTDETVSPELPEEVVRLIDEGEMLTRDWSSPRFAIAMAEGTSETARVYIRGNHRSLGKEVPGRFLAALGGEKGDRLVLAEQVADESNPLTARVMVNRVWHHLFGAGLVPTVDDFGPMGQPPSHPELLDWLASDFVENGWSVKHLIRSIVLSATYRQSSAPHPELDRERIAGIDPGNALLHRMPVRRLSAEAIRDSILAVSGRLDRTMHGESVPTHRTQFMTGRGARESGPLDGDGRRSLYGAVYRNFLSPFMLTFDAPSPFGPKGRRNVSNVPAQALVLMNDPFVAEQSRLWAKRLLVENVSADERIVRMYLAGIGRAPSRSERASVKDFLAGRPADDSAADLTAWSDLAHVLINMKEFIFLP
ncbi:MAG: PSD1 and planctomycete cytochrome C domain-containing protein [Verrucomicrobiales bacterium]